MEPMIFVTSNENKVREASHILGILLEQKTVELDEIQSMDLRPIVEHKLRQAYQLLGRPVLVEDAGLYLAGWHDFPGPFIKFVRETMGYSLLAQALGADRRAAHVVMYGYFDGNQSIFAEGRTEGLFLAEPRGEGLGWGFDPYFLPHGSHLTQAELGLEAKSQISARRKALEKLKPHLIK